MLVQRARNEQEGRLLVEVLEQAGIDAFLRQAPGYAYDGLESVWMGSELYGIYVLEHAAADAERLVKEYLEAPPARGVAGGSPPAES